MFLKWRRALVISHQISDARISLDCFSDLFFKKNKKIDGVFSIVWPPVCESSRAVVNVVICLLLADCRDDDDDDEGGCTVSLQYDSRCFCNIAIV